MANDDGEQVALFGEEPTERTARERLRLLTPEELRVGKVRRDAPPTSVQAARAIMPRSGTARGKVLGAIAAASWGAGYIGLTDEEVSDRLAMSPSTERPRRVELVEGGYVEDSGMMRRTRSGSAAIVWRATPAGRAWYMAERGNT